MIKKSFGALLGNAMQFYDFTIYAFLAPYISKEFFNYESQFISYLMVFGVFASGYLSRPLGALLFGYIGDKKGRSYALSKTIIISTFATFIMGVIPGYDKIGVYAPLFLVILRLIQGVAVSGEEGGAVVLLFEKFSFKKQGVIGGTVLSSVLAGVVLGTIICVITDLLIEHSILSAWAWRIPFILALPFGAIALVLRLYLSDFNSFNVAIEKKLILKTPTKILLSDYPWAIFYGFCIVSIYSITTSTLIVHLPYYLTKNIGYSHYISLSILMLAISIIAFLTPWIGKHFNKVEPKSIYKLALLGFTLLAPLQFYILSFGSFISTACAVLIFTLIISLISCTVFSILVGIFPFNIRYSGVSLAFNLAVTIFSSTTPLALIFFENKFNSELAPGIYLSIISLLLLSVIHLLNKRLFLPDCYKNDSESFMYPHKTLI